MNSFYTTKEILNRIETHMEQFGGQMPEAVYYSDLEKIGILKAGKKITEAKYKDLMVRLSMQVNLIEVA